MAKKRSGSSTRKPPAPTEDHGPIADWMRRAMPELQPIVERVDEMVREELSDLRYAIKWNKVHYGVPGHGWVIELVAYDVSVNIVFLGGADFDTPPPLGESNRSRYIKITDMGALETPEIRSWIQQAGRVDGWSWD